MDEHHYKSWAEAAGLPETSARLTRLPPGLNFPDDFPEPIHCWTRSTGTVRTR